jgi:hypothetical protein
VNKIKHPKKPGWYRWVQTDPGGPFGIENNRDVVGFVFRSSSDSKWCFYGTHIYAKHDGSSGGNHFSMLLKSFVGRGDFFRIKELADPMTDTTNKTGDQ